MQCADLFFIVAVGVRYWSISVIVAGGKWMRLRKFPVSVRWNCPT